MMTSEPASSGGSGLWPTPKANFAQRKSRKAMTPSALGGQSSPPDLAQAVELSMGITPREMVDMPQVQDDQPLTLFAADSPASPSASRGRGSRRRIAGGSGQPSQASFASYDPGGCLWRTFQGCLDGGWETWSGTWPRSGMTRSGIAFRRVSSVPPIYATGSGLWPTPVAQDDQKSPEAHLAMKARMPGGPRQAITSLTVMVKAVERELWPTPTVGDSKNARNSTATRHKLPPTGIHDGAHSGRTAPAKPGQTTSLDMQVNARAASPGQLNPEWVEWLMGYPAGWTDSGD